MKSRLAIAALITLAVSSPFLVWGADIASDTERAKRQVAMLPTLQETVATATGHKKSSIEVKSSAHQVTIAVVNSDLNDSSTAQRTADASNIASACGKLFAGNADFATVVIIHVDYVKRVGNKSTVVEGVDFNKAPNGSFKLHLT